jgi:ATP-dependent exoDNAse (exonuclease V) beta subunit
LADSLPADLDAIRLMTIHQAKGLEFPVVVMADTEARPRPETSDVLFDPDVGLAVSHRGRPIAACAPDKKNDKEAAPTALDRVRARKRQRDEAEMARLLYVALTRARDHLFFVEGISARGRQGGKHLKALLHRAEGMNPEAFEKILPGRTLLPEHRPARPLPHEKKAILHERPRAETPRGRQRVAFSKVAHGQHPPIPTHALAQRVHRPQGLEDANAPGDLRDLARLWGIEGHALFAHLAEMEAPAAWTREAIATTADAFFRSRGGSSIEAGPLMEALIDRVAHTLKNQLEPLWTEATGLSTEVPLTFFPDDTRVVEGQADLIVWRDKGPLVVELKTSDAEYRAGASWIQAGLYAAALSRGLGTGTSYAVWLLGHPQSQPEIELLPEHVEALAQHLSQVDSAGDGG